MKFTKNIRHYVAALVIGTSSFAALVPAAVADEFDRWSTHVANESRPVDHTPMSNILRFLTVEAGKTHAMDYARLTGKPMDYVVEYRKFLENIPVSVLNKDEQLAFWLNLHNVAVIENLGKEPKARRKVKKLRGEPGKPGQLWSQKLVTVEGVSLSLEDIEQNILVRHWSENPDVIYGLFYGTKGSPFQGVRGFQGTTVNKQLGKLAEQFLNNRQNVKVRKGEVQVSSIIAWNKQPLFSNDDSALIAHIQSHAKGRLARDMANVNGVNSKHKFGWSSNAYIQPRQAARLSGSGGSYGGGGFGRGGGS
ncbi:DUF547 domain-containing protein [Alteromonadaceae bacterium M269]|nr:DUF547 domain-containing protein [Alteromonadaceae bacterium M269]